VSDPQHRYRVVPAGDSAVAVEFDERIDREVNGRVIALAAALDGRGVPGMLDVVPAFRTLTVFFDPLKTDRDGLIALIEREAARSPDRPVEREPKRIPVCYGGELGPDLTQVARFGGMSEEEAARLHADGSYRVFMLGFVPGFAYLGLVDERIAVPRHATPRTRVPRGSVGIAGQQTGIYPADTPGGWQIVGRTPVRPFDLGREEPFLLAAGDCVQFYAIDRPEYDRLDAGERS
jgi:inhibitor of KinA